MTIKHMRIFIQVYRDANITKASETLHMTQPAVTRAIQELERYYGVKLFERFKHRLYVTQSGRQLYPQALHMVDLFDRMEKGLRDWDEFGILRVGATITLGTYLLPQLVCKFRRKHPHVRVQARIASGAKIQQALSDNELDIALIEGQVDTPHLYSEPFCSDHLCLILSPKHRLASVKDLSLADLGKEDFLLREPGSAGRSFLDSIFAAHNLSVSPLWESASTQALVRAVGMGLGISILPEQLVLAGVANGQIVTRKLKDEAFERIHFLAWHENKYLTGSAKDFIYLAKRFCTEEEEPTPTTDQS